MKNAEQIICQLKAFTFNLNIPDMNGVSFTEDEYSHVMELYSNYKKQAALLGDILESRRASNNPEYYCCPNDILEAKTKQ